MTAGRKLVAAQRNSDDDGDAESVLIYVHGIGEQKPPDELKLEWDLALFGRERGDQTRMAYWSDLLHPVADVRTRRARMVGDEEDDQSGPWQWMEEAGLDVDDPAVTNFLDGILHEVGAQERSVGPQGKVLPLPRFMREPIARAFLRRFLKDAGVYLFQSDKRSAIRERLEKQLPKNESTPVTIVAHSLGTVIALEVLSSWKKKLDLVKLVTLGSPLGLTEVQDRLDVAPHRTPFSIPSPIQRWHNFSDPFDPVAMDKKLGGEFRPAPDATGPDADVQVVNELVLNERTRSFRDFNPHSAVGYLAHPKVRRSVYESVRFDTMARFILARDVAERLAIRERHSLLIEILEPGYPDLEESRTDVEAREESEMKKRAKAGKKPAISVRLSDRIEEAKEELAILVRDVAKQLGEDEATAEDEASIDGLRRFVSARLSPIEIRALAAQHSRFKIYTVWRSTQKTKLITRSRCVLQVDASHESYKSRGKGVTWAVLDTGIRSDHPHFEGRVRVIWDCTTRGEPKLVETDLDRDGHGSHVAGIIAGQGEHGEKTACSMAPEADLVIYKVLNDRGEGEDAWIIKALDHIAQQNEDNAGLAIHGLNLSLGGPYDSTVYGCGFTPVCQELRRLWRSGVLVVIASGNEGQTEVKTTDGNVELNTSMSIGDPANLEDCIAVGSVHADRPHLYGVSSFSSRGPTSDGRCKPDVVAPGEKIWSANSRFRADRPSTHYRVESGTSMAAPHVSGLLAAFLSARREFIGRPDEVKRMLLATCTDLGRDRNHQGAGMPNLMKMLLSV